MLYAEERELFMRRERISNALINNEITVRASIARARAR